MLVARDKNKTFHSNFELPQFIVVVEQLQLHFNSFKRECLAGLKLVRYERLERSETTTTNGFDGRLFSFPVRATSTAIW